MKKKEGDKRRGIYWKDIRVYHDGGTHAPTDAYTEGVVVHEDNRFLFVLEPETILFTNSGPRNHPQKRARWYVIPKSLVVSTEICK